MNKEEEREVVDLQKDVGNGPKSSGGRPRATGRNLVSERRERPTHQTLERVSKKKSTAAYKAIRATEEDYNYIMDIFYEEKLNFRHEALTEIVKFHKKHHQK